MDHGLLDCVPHLSEVIGIDAFRVPEPQEAVDSGDRPASAHVGWSRSGDQKTYVSVTAIPYEFPGTERDCVAAAHRHAVDSAGAARLDPVHPVSTRGDAGQTVRARKENRATPVRAGAPDLAVGVVRPDHVGAGQRYLARAP